ncbi:retrovirus-related pol polyprotein from transposon TNT 1-94 [Tanacetum coccineum]
MTTMAENVIAARADNRPPMLGKSMYNSWQSRMLLDIRRKEHDKDLLDSLLHGPFQYGIVVEDGIARVRTNEELTDKEKICEECDIRATNMVLQGLPPDVYNLVNHHILDFGLVVPSFLPGDDPIASLNKAMAFISTIISSRYPTTNNQLRTSFNPINQAIIQDGRVTIQHMQGRQSQSFTGLFVAITVGVKTDDLDAFNSNYDEAPSARAVLIANLSSYDSDVLSEVPISETYQDNSVLNHCVQEMYYSEQPASVPTSDIEIITHRIQPVLYDGTVLAKKHDVIFVTDSKETLTLAEDKQAFWLLISKPVQVKQPVVQPILVKTDVPRQLPSRSLVKTSFQKLKRHLDNFDKVVKLIISQDIVHTAVNSYAAIVDYQKMEKSFVDEYNYESVINSRVLAPGIYKLDLPPISSTLRKNKEVHEEYLTVTKEHVDTLYGIVEQARSLEPSNNALDYARKYAQRIQVLLVCVNASCPSSQKDSAKSVVAKTKNRNRRVTFEEKRDTSATKTQKQVESQSKQTTNKALLPSTGDPMYQTLHLLLVFNAGRTDRTLQASGTVRFGNDQVARIMGYGDYQLRNVIISRVYYVEGLGHNLFSMGQFCDSNLELAFQKHTCFVHNLEGADLLTGSRDTNLYTLSLDDMLKSSLICLLSKASKTKSWLWHRRLSHLNFSTINELAKQGLVRGLPKLKYEKDHLCSACSLGKSKKHTYKPNSKDFIQEKLYLLHMDLCGSMRIESINRKKYILVIMIQVHLNATVKNIRTDNGTEFVNQTLKAFYEDVGISHQTPFARTQQHNGIVERQYRILVEVARTMLIFSKAPLYLWAEAVATAFYTQNQSLIRKRHNKTPYKLLHDRKPNLKYFYVFGALCYPTNDGEDLGNLQRNADIEIFVGYSPLTVMASELFGSSPELQLMNPGTISSGLAQNPSPSTPYPTKVVSRAPPVAATIAPIPVDTTVKPNNYKEALKESSWIEAMQEEIYEFERLQVWELVPRPDYVMLINLKGIFKVKQDEFVGVLKNKAKLVSKGFCHEEGFYFEHFVFLLFLVLFRPTGYSISEDSEEEPIEEEPLEEPKEEG